MSTPKPLADQLVHLTARIEADKPGGKTSRGTGFFYTFRRGDADGREIPAIVTNKHVVDGSATGRIRFHLKGGDGEPVFGEHVEIKLPQFSSLWVQHPNPDIDLATMPLAPLVEHQRRLGRELFLMALSKQELATPEKLSTLTAVEDIWMIGYPNALWDSKNNRPIVRRGITATSASVDFEGRPEFLIDCACFPGSSGSPVMLVNEGAYAGPQGLSLGSRFMFLGVLYAGPQYEAEGDVRAVPVPTEDTQKAYSRIPVNLGYCVKATELNVFEELFAKLLETADRARAASDTVKTNLTSDAAV